MPEDERKRKQKFIGLTKDSRKKMLSKSLKLLIDMDIDDTENCLNNHIISIVDSTLSVEQNITQCALLQNNGIPMMQEKAFVDSECIISETDSDLSNQSVQTNEEIGDKLSAHSFLQQTNKGSQGHDNSFATTNFCKQTKGLTLVDAISSDEVLQKYSQELMRSEVTLDEFEANTVDILVECLMAISNFNSLLAKKIVERMKKAIAESKK